MCTTPYRVAAIREPSPAVIVPRKPIRWDHVGGMLTIVGCVTLGVRVLTVVAMRILGYVEYATCFKWAVLVSSAVIVTGMVVSFAATFKASPELT